VVPPRGQALPGRLSQTDISVIAAIVRGTDDLEIALAVMAGPDEIDAAGYKLTLAAPRQKSLRDFKIAGMLTEPNAEVEAEV
jgi:amidase